MMNKALILQLLQQASAQLDATFAAVPAEKLNWKPLDNGRTALDLYGEAAQTCRMLERLIATNGEEKPSRELLQQMRQERANWTRETAQSAMETNAAALLAAVESLSEEQLATELTVKMGGDMTLPLAGWTMMGYRTLVSRFAQINYIQTLYGDFDAH